MDLRAKGLPGPKGVTKSVTFLPRSSFGRLRSLLQVLLESDKEPGSLASRYKAVVKGERQWQDAPHRWRALMRHDPLINAASANDCDLRRHDDEARKAPAECQS